MQPNDVIPIDPNAPIREGRRFTFNNDQVMVELQYLGPNIQAIITNTSAFDVHIEIGDKQGRGNIKDTTPGRANTRNKVVMFPQAMRDMKEVDLQLTISIQPVRTT